MTAEFPTYDQAFAYTQAYSIEDGSGLTKKHTNYWEKGGCLQLGSVLRPRILAGESRRIPAGQGKEEAPEWSYPNSL